MNCRLDIPSGRKLPIRYLSGRVGRGARRGEAVISLRHSVPPLFRRKLDQVDGAGRTALMDKHPARSCPPMLQRM